MRGWILVVAVLVVMACGGEEGEGQKDAGFDLCAQAHAVGLQLPECVDAGHP